MCFTGRMARGGHQTRKSCVSWCGFHVQQGGGVHAVKNMKKIVNLLKKKERKRQAYLVHPVLSHPPSLLRSNERKCDKEGEIPLHHVQNEKKHETQWEGAFPSRHVQNERKCDEEGGTPSCRVQNKKKGNKEGGTPPCHSQNERKRKGTRRGEPLPVAVKTKGKEREHDEERFSPSSLHLSFSPGRWGQVGENGGGCAASSSCWGGMRCQILKENTKKGAPCTPIAPFPSLPFCTILCCCRPPFVFSGTAGGGWGWVRVSDGRRWWCGSWWALGIVGPVVGKWT